MVGRFSLSQKLPAAGVDTHYFAKIENSRFGCSAVRLFSSQKDGATNGTDRKNHKKKP
jgi:hypothetical protein